MKKWIKIILIAILSIILIGLLIPQNLKMPVVGADNNSYNHETFWHEGWGSSVVHKGVDFFAKKGTSCLTCFTLYHIGNKVTRFD